MGYNQLKRHAAKSPADPLQAFQLNRLGKRFDNLGEIGEGVRKFGNAWHFRRAEARWVRSHEVEMIRQQRNHVVEHLRRTRTANATEVKRDLPSRRHRHRE